MEFHLLEYQALILSGLVILLSFICLFLYTKRRSRPGQLFLFSVILVVFLWPPTFFSLSNANLERSKGLEFCGSCHDMNLHITDGTNPRSKSLAAKHITRYWVNKNPCYTCHTDYTMFGPFKAKISGLKHFYTSQFLNKDEKDIKLFAAYPDSNCMQCHDTRQFKKVEEHEDRDPDESCIDCHDKIHVLSKKDKVKK